jgi:hypothetical protein
MMLVLSNSNGGASKITCAKLTLPNRLLNFSRGGHSIRNIDPSTAKRFKPAIVDRDKMALPLNKAYWLNTAWLHGAATKSRSQIIYRSVDSILEACLD